jgi:hypothetical protein
MKTTVKIFIFLFLLIDNVTFAQPHIKYSIGQYANAANAIEYDGEPSIDIGDFQVGCSTEGYGIITIYNTGNGSFQILSIDIDGDFSLNFDFDILTVTSYDRIHGTHTPPIPGIGGRQYRFDVSFSPTALGHHTGTLRIYHNAPNSPSPMTIRFTGNGVSNGVSNGVFVPHIKYSIGQDANDIEYDGEPSIDIGDFQVGSSIEGYGVITIYNTGNAPLEILSIDVDGDFNINFDFDIWTVRWYDSFYGKHTPSIAIPSGSKYTFDVSFSPTALGHHTGTLRIYHNASNSPSPMTIRFTGNGVNNGRPLIETSGLHFGLYPFPTTQIGTSEVQGIDISNTGNAPLNISYTIIGDGFYSTWSNDATIQPNSGNSYNIVFAPIVPGFHSCTLTIYHDATNLPSPIIQYYTGNAVTHIVEAARELDFGNVDIGSSLTKTLTITNYGFYDFIVLSYEVYGNSVFTLLNNQLPITIEGGIWTNDNKYNLIVEFTPTDTRTYTGTINLTATYGWYTGPMNISLSGTGIDKEIFTEEPKDIPTTYNLAQNYPNPFNPTTKIEYSLPEASMVRLAIYNSLGQEVASLVNEYKATGKYIVDFNANNLPSGMYFYKLQSDKFNAIKKMTLLK